MRILILFISLLLAGEAMATTTPFPFDKDNYTKPSDAELRKRLTPMQYQITQQDRTERPYHNEYWNNTQPGIYVDVVSGEPLFSSVEMFDSRTGWPAFSTPLVPENIVMKKARSWLFSAPEARSKYADSHLGHVLKGGPLGTYHCINSAALTFIPVAELEKKGYGEYKKLFK